MSERRIHERFALQLRVDLRQPDGAESTHQAVTEDICASGFYVAEGPPALREGSHVEVVLWLPMGTEDKYAGLRGLGRVVRVDRGPGEKAGVAVRLDRVDFVPEDVKTFT